MAQIKIEPGRHQIEINSLLAENRQLQSENLRLHSQIKELKVEKLELVINNEFLTKKGQQLENLIQALEDEMKAMNVEILQLKGRKEMLEECYQKKKNEIIKADKDHLEKIMAVMGEKIELAQAHARELEYYYIRREVDKKQEQEEVLKSYQKLNSEYELYVRLYKQSDEHRRALAADKRSLQSKVSSLLEEKEALRDDLAILRKDLDRSKVDNTWIILSTVLVNQLIIL